MPDFNRYETAISLVQGTLAGMGLPRPTTLVGNTNETAIQMLQLLTDLGQELAKACTWQMYSRDQSLSVIDPTLEYDVPEDLDFYVQNAGWNRTARIPLIGPLTDQQWALLQARQLGGTTLYLQFIHQNDKIVFYFAPSTAQDVVLPYKGRGWVQDASVLTTFRDYIAADGDKILYDPLLIRMGLKVKFREAKGFDVTKLQNDYDEYLDEVKARDMASPMLFVSRQPAYPYIGVFNLPDTGYGTP